MANLIIPVTMGMGAAPTRLGAFDAALDRAGVSNFNLIRLSSIIPPGSTVEPHENYHRVQGGYGDRLYAVWAIDYADRVGQTAEAALAWEYTDEGGVLVEEHGAYSRSRVHSSLDDVAGRRGIVGKAGVMTARIECERDPVCALVIASLKAEPW